MQTTLDIDDALLEAARDKAKRDGVSLSALVEEALRAAVANGAIARPQPAQRSRLPVSGARGGLRPGLVISSYADFLDEADRQELEDARTESRPPRFR
jgi:hypothetical protein